MRVLMRELNKGRSIGLVMGQRVDSGTPLPFFGIPKLTTLIPARLAVRFECELVPVRAQRLEGARFKITFYPPVQPDDGTAGEVETAKQMTLKVNAMLEQWILEAPEDWICTKRRWPKDAHSALQSSPRSDDIADFSR